MKMSKTNLTLVADTSKPKDKSKKSGGHPFERTTTYLAWPEELVIPGIDEPNEESVLFDKERKDLELNPDLLDSIMRYGVKKNVNARRNASTGKFEIVDGRQRVLHAREANRLLTAKGEKPRKILCRVELGSDDLMFELMITLNQHIESTPLMKARLAERFYMRSQSVGETCRVCRVSEHTFKEWMELLQMDKEVHDAIDEGKISCNQALKFVKLPHDKQRETLKSLVEMGAKKARPKSEKSEDKAKMPSKATLLGVVNQAEEAELDPNFLLGLQFALGIKRASELRDVVPGFKNVKGIRK